MPKPPPDAFEKSLRFLSMRPLSETELLTKLQRAGYPDNEANAAIEKCRKLHYLDDELLAVDSVSALRQRNLGTRQIKFRLAKRGLDPEAVAGLLADNPQEEFEAAFRAMQGKMRLLRHESDPRKKREKLFRFLIGRGFSPDIILRVLDSSTETDDEL